MARKIDRARTDVPPHIENLVGRNFNRLSVVGYLGIYKKFSLWECACECGQTVQVQGRNLKSGGSKSCGCIKGEKKVKNLAGVRFGWWTVISFHARRWNGHGSAWLCRCDCGNEKVVAADILSSGECSSCGCKPRKRTPTEIRFWSKVEKTDGCWNWIAKSTTDFGYGFLFVNDGDIANSGTHALAHRYSWELHNGPIPNGQKVLHSCDNPPCVRPDHLFLGTLGDNSQDMMEKDRNGYVVWRGELNGHAKLNWRKIDEIRALHRILGWSIKRLSRLYGIAESHVGRIVRKEVWKEEHRHNKLAVKTLAMKGGFR